MIVQQKAFTPIVTYVQVSGAEDSLLRGEGSVKFVLNKFENGKDQGYWKSVSRPISALPDGAFNLGAITEFVEQILAEELE